MTKEFKTLKDFEDYSCVECYELKQELKAEAIKWVKEYQLSPFGTFCEFFNITKEDLK